MSKAETTLRRKLWEKANRERINAQRRARYRKNPTLRRANNARCRAWWKKHHARLPPIPPGLLRKPTWATLTIVQPSGQKSPVKVLVATIGYFARRMGVVVKTVRRWENNGYIPKLNFRLPDGARIWPLMFIDVVKDVLYEYPIRRGGLSPEETKATCNEVVTRWNKQKLHYLNDPNYGMDQVRKLRPLREMLRKNGEKEVIGGSVATSGGHRKGAGPRTEDHG